MANQSSRKTGDKTSQIDQLYRDLRQALVGGQLSEAEEISERILSLLSEAEDFSTDALSENQLHRECMDVLVDAITAILVRDTHTGLKHLSALPNEVLLNDSLLWVARIWTGLAYRNSGNIIAARNAVKGALDLARRLDPAARSTSLYLLAVLEYLDGDHDEAMQKLDAMLRLNEELGDPRGMATARLAQARIQAAADNHDMAAYIAHNALVLDPSWAEPVIFLARQAMKNGKIRQAELILAMLDRLVPRPPEAEREQALIGLVRRQHIPLRVLRSYLQLEEALPSREVVQQLEELREISPEFLHLQENLAWKLLQLGRSDAAAQQFKALAGRKLDPALHSSVMLGLSTVATMVQGQSQAGKRLRAAVRALPESMKPLPAPRTASPGRHSAPTRLLQAVTLDELAVRATRHTAKKEKVVAVNKRHATSRGSEERLPVNRVDDKKAPSPLDILDGRRAVFRGDLRSLGPPELLQFFNSSRLTGTLIISSKFGITAIYFRRGKISGAVSPGCRSIGDLLVAEGKISREQIEQATRFQQNDREDLLLGAIIVERGLVDHATTRAALESQVYHAVSELMSWSDGEFAFTPDTLSKDLPSEVEINLDPQNVLLDVLQGIRR